LPDLSFVLTDLALFFFNVVLDLTNFAGHFTQSFGKFLMLSLERLDLSLAVFGLLSETCDISADLTSFWAVISSR